MDKAPISNYFVLNGDKMILFAIFKLLHLIELYEIDELIIQN